MRKYVIIISAALFLYGAQAFACEPCFENKSPEESVQAADTIFIGHKTSDGPQNNSGMSGHTPEYIEVAVESVLKGDLALGAVVKLAAWYGMCGYGFTNIAFDQSYMFFVKQIAEGDNTYFVPIDGGCSMMTMVIQEGDRVTYDESLLTVDEFVALHQFTKLGPSVKKDADMTSKQIDHIEQTDISYVSTSTTQDTVFPWGVLLLAVTAMGSLVFMIVSRKKTHNQ